MEYPKIETLYERNTKFKVQPGVFKNRTYSILKTWHWTEKIDGTNTRIIYVPEISQFDGGVGCDRIYPASVTVGGRTDNANMPADLVQNLLAQVTPQKMFDVFQGSQVVLYGEGYGGNIQKGSGYSLTKKFILFDVLIENKWWMNFEQITDIAAKLGLNVVPSMGEMTLEEATEFVKAGFTSKIAVDPAKMAEGLVGRPLETLFDKKHHRLITKLKTKDF